MLSNLFINKELCLILFICVVVMQSHPIGKNEAPEKEHYKQELRFPNGTVLGGYNYTDKNGNPVAIKYFADEDSYGIEFKSVKVTGVKTPSDSFNFLDSHEILDPEVNADFEKSKKETSANKEGKVRSIKKNDNSVSTTVSSTSPDYEIFSQNEITNPKKCNNEKVRVYYNRDKNRYVRSPEQDADDMSKFCAQVK